MAIVYSGFNVMLIRSQELYIMMAVLRQIILMVFIFYILCIYLFIICRDNCLQSFAPVG